LRISPTPKTNRTRGGVYGVPRRRRAGFAFVPGFWRNLFRGRWLVATIVVLIAIGVMVRLGVWQLNRLEGRRAANAAITQQINAPPLPLDAQTAASADPTTLTFRRVSVRGTWDYAHEVELRYRSFDGQAGIHLLTPLKIDGSDIYLLVDRGWIPYQQADQASRRAYQQNERAAIEGLVNESHTQGDTKTDPGTFAQIDIPAISAQLPYPLLSYWVQRLPSGDNQTPPKSEGVPDLSDGTHFAYMIQWWAFAGTLLVTYIIFANQTMRRSTKKRRSANDPTRTP
jgi:surfeit locus 1 family protein